MWLCIGTTNYILWLSPYCSRHLMSFDDCFNNGCDNGRHCWQDQHDERRVRKLEGMYELLKLKLLSGATVFTAGLLLVFIIDVSQGPLSLTRSGTGPSSAYTVAFFHLYFPICNFPSLRIWTMWVLLFLWIIYLSGRQLLFCLALLSFRRSVASESLKLNMREWFISCVQSAYLRASRNHGT